METCKPFRATEQEKAEAEKHYGLLIHAANRLWKLGWVRGGIDSLDDLIQELVYPLLKCIRHHEEGRQAFSTLFNVAAERHVRMRAIRGKLTRYQISEKTNGKKVYINKPMLKFKFDSELSKHDRSVIGGIANQNQTEPNTFPECVTKALASLTRQQQEEIARMSGAEVNGIKLDKKGLTRREYGILHNRYMRLILVIRQKLKMAGINEYGGRNTVGDIAGKERGFLKALGDNLL